MRSAIWGHLDRVDGKQKTPVSTRTYPEGGERRNRICTEEVIDSQVSERYGRHFGRWRDHKILLRSKRVNKSSLENFVKSSERVTVICCLENGFVLESRVCILLDSIRAIISYWKYYMYCGWSLGLACLLDPNLFLPPAVISILCFYCDAVTYQCDLLVCDMI